MLKAVRRRILLCVAAAVLLCIALSCVAFDLRLTSQAKAGLEKLAASLAFASSEDISAVGAASRYSKALGGVRVTFISASGEVLSDSVTTNLAANHLNREEIQKAKKSGKGSSVRDSTTVGAKLIYSAAKTADGNYVRVSESYASVSRDFIELLPLLALVFLLLLAPSYAIARRFAQSVTRPLADMQGSIKLLQSGANTLNAEDYQYPELKDMARDINEISSEVAKSLEHLEYERERIGYILDNMSEGFIMLSEEDNILLINSVACEAFLCERDHVRDKHILHATRNVELIDAIQMVHSDGHHRSIKLLLADKCIGEANISKVRPDGGVIIIISDVTLREQSVKMRSDFFEAASHELKTPITSISGFAELLCAGTIKAEDERQEIFARIAKESSRMSSLIEDIIMISRLESGDIVYEQEALDMGEVVREVCDEAAVTAQKCGVSIECEACSAMRTASRKEMRELVSNLVQNAVKYNVCGGRVEVKLASHAGAYTLSVFNTGEEISPEYRTRIFERFYRIDKSRSKAVGGTGLGLAIVKHIAGKYNLELKLDSSQEGNTFTVKEHAHIKA